MLPSNLEAHGVWIGVPRDKREVAPCSVIDIQFCWSCPLIPPLGWTSGTNQPWQNSCKTPQTTAGAWCLLSMWPVTCNDRSTPPCRTIRSRSRSDMECGSQAPKFSFGLGNKHLDQLADKAEPWIPCAFSIELAARRWVAEYLEAVVLDGSEGDDKAIRACHECSCTVIRSIAKWIAKPSKTSKLLFLYHPLASKTHHSSWRLGGPVVSALEAWEMGSKLIIWYCAEKKELNICLVWNIFYRNIAISFKCLTTNKK